jgi:hypothetical protein
VWKQNLEQRRGGTPATSKSRLRQAGLASPAACAADGEDGTEASPPLARRSTARSLRRSPMVRSGPPTPRISAVYRRRRAWATLGCLYQKYWAHSSMGFKRAQSKLDYVCLMMILYHREIVCSTLYTITNSLSPAFCFDFTATSLPIDS